MIVRKDKCITILEGDKLRNEIDNGSIASWDIPSTSGRAARLLGKSILTCNKGCRKTANLEDVSDIVERQLSSTDDGP